MATYNRAIWQDRLVSLGANPRDFIIKMDGSTTIFAGRGVSRPGQTYPQVLLNDIAEKYLAQDASCIQNEEGDGYYAVAGLQRTFQVYDSSGSTAIGDTYNFGLDWSRESGRNVWGRYGAHDPINGRVSNLAPFIITLYGSTPLTLDGGSASNIRLLTDQMATSINVMAYQGPGNYTIQLVDYLGGGETWVEFNGNRYEVVQGCSDVAVLYYVNAYGAWDALLIEGAITEGHEYERHTLQRAATQDATTRNRAIWNYLNEERRTWALRTGPLTTAQSSRMHHLIGSTLAVLFMQFDGAYSFVPVTITDTEVQHRLMSDGKFAFYTINVAEAVEGQRR